MVYLSHVWIIYFACSLSGPRVSYLIQLCISICSTGELRVPRLISFFHMQIICSTHEFLFHMWIICSTCWLSVPRCVFCSMGGSLSLSCVGYLFHALIICSIYENLPLMLRPLTTSITEWRLSSSQRIWHFLRPVFPERSVSVMFKIYFPVMLFYSLELAFFNNLGSRFAHFLCVVVYELLFKSCFALCCCSWSI